MTTLPSSTTGKQGGVNNEEEFLQGLFQLAINAGGICTARCGTAMFNTIIDALAAVHKYTTVQVNNLRSSEYISLKGEVETISTRSGYCTDFTPLLLVVVHAKDMESTSIVATMPPLQPAGNKGFSH